MTTILYFFWDGFSGADAPLEQGSVGWLEYTMPRLRMEYTMPKLRMEYTMPVCRLNYTLEAED